MQKKEVYMRADYRYGPDDPTLWPQPWIVQYPHLGAIPRKPNDPKDTLSIMWWDPTCETDWANCPDPSCYLFWQ